MRDAKLSVPSLRANGSRECAPDDSSEAPPRAQRRSIHLTFLRRNGLLRCARNDGCNEGAHHDGAYPFKEGVAVVCTACSYVSDSTATEGERGWYEGGEWGRIDRTGRVVSPFRPQGKGKPLEFD